ncbi:MAG: hypothetical protein GX558_06235, partial [Clostridiales bacterium]|nr:hypothetical protein [Clostridiales bacterium]
DFEMRSNAGAHCASIELHKALCGERVDAFGDARGLTMAVTLFDDGPGVDIRWTLHDKEATPLVESGHFTFPLAASAPEYRFDKLGSVVDPARDIAPGANNRLYCAESFVDVCEEGRGLAIMLKDAPLFSLGEPAIYRYDRAYVAREPNVLGVAFANSWGTNFPQWMGGTLTCRYRLIPHEGDWRQAEVPRRALEWTRPPLAIEGAALPGEPMLRCPPGMRLLALKRAEDGDGYIARLIDLTGRGRTETLPVGSFVRRAQLCDGQEYNLRPLPIEGRAIALDMRPFGLCTLRLHADG